jgi:hypothetical protein
MSVPSRISVPPAMIGLRGRSIFKKPFQARSGSACIFSAASGRASSSSASPAMALRSAPDEKLPPAPVRMMALTSPSAAASA